MGIWDSEMFPDLATQDSIVSRGLRFLIHQQLLCLVVHALLDIIAPQERLILWAVRPGRTMIAQANLTARNVVQGTIVHQTQPFVSWNVHWVITVPRELKHLLITLVQRVISTIKREGKA